MNLRSSSFGGLLHNRNFRLLWAGQATSLLGDQFFMIALPWLVLKLTGDPLALGTVLALTGVPRAVFMLLGGAFTDRYSPRTIMLVSDLLRLGLTAVLAALILSDGIQLWMLYLLALAFGTISGFFNPASSAMMPRVVGPIELQAGNSVYEATSQFVVFLGPVLAGGVISWFAHTGSPGSSPAELGGIAAAVGFDALSFLVSAFTLGSMHFSARPEAAAPAKNGLLAAIGEGVSYVGQDPLLRMVFILIVGLNLLFAGPFLVGIPVLANERFTDGAAAFGFIMSGFGGGNLLGILLSGALARYLNPRMSGFLVLAVATFGVGMALLSVVTTPFAAFLVLVLFGVGNGSHALALLAFLQRSTPPAMLGRVMSLLLLANVGLVPLSQAVAGALIKLSLSGLFVGAGVLLVALALWLALHPARKFINQAFVLN
jgi:hypothetical protein